MKNYFIYHVASLIRVQSIDYYSFHRCSGVLYRFRRQRFPQIGKIFLESKVMKTVRDLVSEGCRGQYIQSLLIQNYSREKSSGNGKCYKIGLTWLRKQKDWYKIGKTKKGGIYQHTRSGLLSYFHEYHCCLVQLYTYSLLYSLLDVELCYLKAREGFTERDIQSCIVIIYRAGSFIFLGECIRHSYQYRLFYFIFVHSLLIMLVVSVFLISVLSVGRKKIKKAQK